MELNGPGTSLFQGNDLSNFDNLEQREEEEEALEEQRRRELELKNELENAFNDVSFENDEESICNGSEHRSSSAHSVTQNNLHSEIEANFFTKTAQGKRSIDSDSPSYRTESFNTPLKHPVRHVQGKEVNFGNEYENFSDECRKKIQNGSSHDIVDQSGGGDQNMQTLLHYNHCFQKNSLGESICNGTLNNNLVVTKYPEEAEDSSEQLKILYDVRVREVHRLTELIDSMRNEHKVEVGDLKHQLALMLAEKERAIISHSQLQNLLVDCKQQVEHLINDVSSLEKDKKELEASKQELMMELDSAKLVIDDLQRKIIVLERGIRSKTEAEQYESHLQSLTEKHNFEIMNLKKELDHYMKNSEGLVKENEELKLKIINLSQSNDENLAKKGEIIRRLSQQIEETQAQLENLMKSSVSENNFRLLAELKLLKEEKSQMAVKLENLEKERCRQEEEIKQYESLSTMSFFNKDSSSNSDLKEFEGSDVNGKLGAELFRALNSQKAKRLEIKNLQTQLDEKNEKISLLNENERSLNMEIASLKEEIKKCLSNLKEKEAHISQKDKENLNLQAKILELEEKLKTSDSETHKKCELLEEENKQLQNHVTALEKEKEDTISNYSEEYMRFHNEGLEKAREEMEKYFKLELLKKDLENESLKRENDEIKNLYVEVCNAKENPASTSQGEKDKSSSGRGSVVDLDEVKKLQKELEKSRHRILELDHTLKQQYEQEVEILNLDISQLRLQLEKLKKEKDREIAEKDKISVENELLKIEIEQITSEKNLLFLDYEKILKEAEELRLSLEKSKENSKNELKKIVDRHALELQNLNTKHEITVKKLKKEIELTVTKAVKTESKYTSPLKNSAETRNAATQGCSYVLVDKSTSPNRNQEIAFSSVGKNATAKLMRDVSVWTDPEPVKIPKKEVVEMMEKLGAHHEEEIMALEKKYCTDLMKLEKKFHMEVDKAKEVIRRELEKEHSLELEQLQEKHKIEMMNRIEQEKKEAVVDLITEWACEVQNLKMSYAESQAEMEKMKMKYKAAKSVALHYKTYFRSKAEHMKEEWKKIEDGYEQALKELEKNVHILVDVKEDEVKTKVDSITRLYEEKINKMKRKLHKFEERLKAEQGSSNNNGGSSEQDKLEMLSVPDGNLRSDLQLLKETLTLSPFKRLQECTDEMEEPNTISKKKGESGLMKPQKHKHHQRGEFKKDKEKLKR